MSKLTLEAAMKLLERMNNNASHYYSLTIDGGWCDVLDVWKDCESGELLMKRTMTAQTPAAAIRAAADRLGVEYQDLLTKESG